MNPNINPKYYKIDKSWLKVFNYYKDKKNIPTLFKKEKKNIDYLLISLNKIDTYKVLLLIRENNNIIERTFKNCFKLQEIKRRLSILQKKELKI